DPLALEDLVVGGAQLRRARARLALDGGDARARTTAATLERVHLARIGAPRTRLGPPARDLGQLLLGDGQARRERLEPRRRAFERLLRQPELQQLRQQPLAIAGDGFAQP